MLRTWYYFQWSQSKPSFDFNKNRFYPLRSIWLPKRHDRDGVFRKRKTEDRNNPLQLSRLSTPKYAGRKIVLLKTEDDLAERNRCKNLKKIKNNIDAKTWFRQNLKFCLDLNQWSLNMILQKYAKTRKYESSDHSPVQFSRCLPVLFWFGGLGK